MRTICYFADQELQILNQSGQRIPLAPNSVVNGVILDEAGVLATLKEHAAALNGCTLILDSSRIMTKVFAYPNMPKRKLLAAIRTDFSAAGQSGTLLVDGNVHVSKDGRTVLACAVERSFIESYVRLFRQAGIRIRRIDTAVNCAIKYIASFMQPPAGKKAQDRVSLIGRSFAFQIVQGSTLLSLLYENGVYLLSTRTRLVNEPGTPAYIAELYERHSFLIQFQTGRKSEYPIEASYYLGLTEQDMASLAEYAAQTGVTLESWEDPDLTGAVVYPFFGRQRDADDLDLLQAYRRAHKEKQGAKKAQKRLPKGLIAVSILVVVIAAVYFALWFQNKGLALKIAELDAYLEDPERQVEALEADRLDEKTERIQTYLGEYRAEAQAEKNGTVDIELIEQLRSLADRVTLTEITFESEDHAFQIRGQATVETEVSSFVQTLVQSDLFADVGYNGYGASGDLVLFSVKCVLKGGAVDE